MNRTSFSGWAISNYRRPASALNGAIAARCSADMGLWSAGLQPGGKLKAWPYYTLCSGRRILRGLLCQEVRQSFGGTMASRRSSSWMFFRRW